MKKIKRSILQFKELYSVQSGNTFTDFSTSSFSENRSSFDAINAAHSEYISTISSPDMAMSLELADFLLKFCFKNKPTVLLDLGSGFSSYVFRLYQKQSDQKITVHSIDDHAEWLEKTKKYLSHQNLSTDHLYELDPFKKTAQPASYDLILLDLNFVEKRKDYIDFSMQLLKPGGVLIVDDVHKVEFLREVKLKAKNNAYRLFNIKSQTKDGFGRFSILLTK